LDERFFGPRPEVDESRWWETRLNLLTEEERSTFEPFVDWKMESMRGRRGVWDWDGEAIEQERVGRRLFSQLLVD